MRLTRRNIQSLLASVILLGAFVVGHHAAALTLIPPSVELSADSGSTLRTTIKLYNEGPDSQTLYTSAANFTAKDESGTPAFDFTQAKEGLASWISPDVTKVTLASGDRQQVGITISIPKDADPGGHYAAVFFGTQPPTASGAVGVASKVGTLFIVRVSGNVNESASVKSFGVSGSSSTFSHLPINVDLRVQNTGNVHIRPKGSVVIKNMFGHVAATVPINTSEGAVLPNSVRKFTVTWGDTATVKGFFGQIGAEWQHFGLGMYTAELQGTYGTTKKSLSGSFTFLMFPWHLLLVEAIVLLLIVYILIFGIKRYNTMIISRAQGGRFPKGRR